MSSITNFTTFLSTNSGASQVAGAAPEPSLDIRILSCVRDAELLSLPDLPPLAKITPEEASRAVDRLRALNQLELVQRPGDALYLRLTTAGYATLKG